MFVCHLLLVMGILHTLSILLQVFFLVLVAPKTSNVCETVWDYLFKGSNKNCWYNPDVDSTTGDMTKRNGYPFEAYQITTDDGFVLSLYRIPHNHKNSNSTRRPIFLLNGIQMSSEIWTYTADRSLAFNLVEKGYDVWLGNFRGSAHSERHLRYSRRDFEYWNHSFHEIALYDVSSFLNFITNETRGNGRVIFIGHSMGGTVSYVYASLKVEEAHRNLAGIISLAPVVFLVDVKSIVKYPFHARKFLLAVLEFFHQYSIFVDYHTMRLFNKFTCDQFLFMPICRVIFYEFGGYDYERITPKEIPLVLNYVPNGGSVKTIAHYAQIMAKKDKFAMYDYGRRNFEVYNQKEPPEYPIEAIDLPVHLVFGGRDYLARPKGVKMFYGRLNTTKSLSEVDYTHADFLNANDLKEYLYPIVMSKIAEIEEMDDGKEP